MAKQTITVNMEGALFEGKECTIDKVARGWIGITDHSGRSKTVRATAIKFNGSDPKRIISNGTGDGVVDPEAIQQESTMMATQAKRSTKVRTSRKARGARKAKVPHAAGTRAIGKAVFTRFNQYVAHKTAAGNVAYDNGDEVAAKLRGMTMDEVYAYAAKKLDETERSIKDKYKHLNAGMIRMNIGNKLRAFDGKKAKAKAKAKE